LSAIKYPLQMPVRSWANEEIEKNENKIKNRENSFFITRLSGCKTIK
jgi:hypothetical protein